MSEEQKNKMGWENYPEYLRPSEPPVLTPIEQPMLPKDPSKEPYPGNIEAVNLYPDFPVTGDENE